MKFTNENSPYFEVKSEAIDTVGYTWNEDENTVKELGNIKIQIRMKL